MYKTQSLQFNGIQNVLRLLEDTYAEFRTLLKDLCNGQRIEIAIKEYNQGSFITLIHEFGRYISLKVDSDKDMLGREYEEDRKGSRIF